MGAGSQAWLEGWWVQLHLLDLDLRQREKRWRQSEWPMTNGATNHAYIMTPLLRPLSAGFREPAGWCRLPGGWLGGEYAWRGHRSSTPLPTKLALCILSVWLSQSCILHNKPTIANKMFPWILWAVLANKRTWGWVGRRVSQEHWFIASESNVRGPGTSNWHLKSGGGRQFCGPAPLPCGVCL